MSDQRPAVLAPHETLELHETLAFLTAGVYKQKTSIAKITDPALRALSMQSIAAMEKNMLEIIALLQNRRVIP